MTSTIIESVEIWTDWPEPYLLGVGHLFVGDDHLPELETSNADLASHLHPCRNRPATAPHTLYLTPLPGQEAGILLWAWRTIQEVQTRLAEAETERVREGLRHTKPDPIDAAKAWADAHREEEA